MRRREARLILGVDEDATTETIKSAFRRYALKHHPDRNPDNPVAEESFKKGAHAYRLLTGQEGADLDELLEQFEDIEQSLDKMKQSFDEFGKNMSEGLDRIETKMSRMFKWTIFLMSFHDPIVGSSHSVRFLILVFAVLCEKHKKTGSQYVQVLHILPLTKS